MCNPLQLAECNNIGGYVPCLHLTFYAWAPKPIMLDKQRHRYNLTVSKLKMYVDHLLMYANKHSCHNVIEVFFECIFQNLVVQ